MSFIELGAIYISFLIVTITIGLIKFNEKMEKMPKIAKSYTAKERNLVGFCVIF